MGTNYYRMFPEHNFAIVRLQSETLSVKEAEQINYQYKTDDNYSNIHYLIIIVDEKCMPDFNISDLEKLSNIYNTEFHTNNHKTIVWLVDEPLATAFTHLFVSKTSDNSLCCSTIEKAYALLNMPVEFEEFKRLISVCL